MSKKQTITAVSIAGTILIASAALVHTKLVHKANMRRALARAKAKTNLPVRGGYIDYTPHLTASGCHYHGGVIVQDGDARRLIRFTFNP